MNIEYGLVETFSALSEKQVTEIAILLKQLSPKRVFSELQLKKSMMFGSMYFATDKDGDDMIVGMGLLTYAHTATYDKGLIEDVVVLDSYQRQGIGKAIMLQLHEKASRYPGGLECIELTSNPTRIEANRLYLRLGYVLRDTNCYRLQLPKPV